MMITSITQLIQTALIPCATKITLDGKMKERRSLWARLWKECRRSCQMSAHYECPACTAINIIGTDARAQLPRRASCRPLRVACTTCSTEFLLAFGVSEVRNRLMTDSNQVHITFNRINNTY